MLNSQFLSAVGAAAARPAAGLLAGQGGAQRRFGLAGGHLISSDSSVAGDDLCALLAAERRLDPRRAAALLTEAAKRQVPAEHLLLEQGVLAPGEVVGALERLAVSRFRRAMTAPGTVAVAPGREVRGAIRLHLGALVLDQFRALPADEVRAYVGTSAGALKLLVKPDDLTALKLQPAELRAARQAEVPLAATAEGPLRLGGALLALGLAAWHP